MTAIAPNVLPKQRPITESFYRARVSDIISRIQREQGLNDKALAELLFVSPETVTNARNGDNKLSGPTLLNLLTVSDTAFEGLLHHFDRRSVPLSAKCDTDALPNTAAAMHKLAVASADGHISDRDCLEMESALDAAIDGLCGLKSRCLTIRENRT